MGSRTGAGVLWESLDIRNFFKLNNSCGVFQVEIFDLKTATYLLENVNSELNGPVTKYALKALPCTIKSMAVLESND